MKELLNRENWEAVMEFLEYKEKTDQNAATTVSKLWTIYRHLIEWAGQKALTQAGGIEPSFPVYLLSARNDGKTKTLAPTTLKKVCDYARMFFVHMKENHPDKYKSIQYGWIKTIKPSKAHGMDSVLSDHAHYTIEDILKISRIKTDSMTEERDKAAACFLFLSGMRADAFVSLPINCIDLKIGKVQQLPSKGVRTKNHKAAITTLLPIPELMDVVRSWDEKVRGGNPGDSVWYAPIKKHNDGFIQAHGEISKNRKVILDIGLHKTCGKAGLTYLSAHKLRHGHVVYALKRVKNLAGLKSVSQNVMHSNVGITDGLYGVFTQDDVHNTITSLEMDTTEKPTSNQGNAVIDALLKKLSENPELLSKLLA